MKSGSGTWVRKNSILLKETLSWNSPLNHHHHQHRRRRRRHNSNNRTLHISTTITTTLIAPPPTPLLLLFLLTRFLPFTLFHSLYKLFTKVLLRSFLLISRVLYFFYLKFIISLTYVKLLGFFFFELWWIIFVNIFLQVEQALPISPRSRVLPSSIPSKPNFGLFF